jgi:hypothetical protein
MINVKFDEAPKCQFLIFQPRVRHDFPGYQLSRKIIKAVVSSPIKVVNIHLIDANTLLLIIDGIVVFHL